MYIVGATNSVAKQGSGLDEQAWGGGGVVVLAQAIGKEALL